MIFLLHLHYSTVLLMHDVLPCAIELHSVLHVRVPTLRVEVTLQSDIHDHEYGYGDDGFYLRCHNTTLKLYKHHAVTQLWQHYLWNRNHLQVVKRYGTRLNNVEPNLPSNCDVCVWMMVQRRSHYLQDIVERFQYLSY